MFKSGRTQSSLTGSTFRGEALKGRSEGNWRSGRRRSGEVGGGGTVNDFVYSVSCHYFTEHTLCQSSANCQLPIADLVLASPDIHLAIGNWKSAML
jgi:hypothetical protein